MLEPKALDEASRWQAQGPAALPLELYRAEIRDAREIGDAPRPVDLVTDRCNGGGETGVRALELGVQIDLQGCKPDHLVVVRDRRLARHVPPEGAISSHDELEMRGERMSRR